ncbi:MAG: TetR/AcrR family transcriptional regulator C-terminal domain-containing protein [Alphaproteobacteria bacterium]|nr:TetR/AcrR family transcriptional regulator C-terminal domain-containing protein [Alphaproteobacteria bacterium]
MPPKAKFTHEQLQEAALALVDSEGLAGLSMRSLAGALGTGPMTLYNYVRDRTALDALVVDAVMAEARWRGTPSTDWQKDLRAIALASWRAVRRHPHVIPLILTRRGRHATTLDFGEALLEVLARSGRSGRDLLMAFRTVSAFITGSAQAHMAQSADQVVDPTIAEVQALGPGRFPRLAEMAKVAERVDADEEFKAGLEILLAGLTASRSR